MFIFKSVTDLIQVLIYEVKTLKACPVIFHGDKEGEPQNTSG
jgi:hypothetical protein